ncbi:MAG: 50S ribosomal protein L28 [Crocinitomicaceae bacterium]|nr:50S ribosomal protein L28 [Crocinitomicaceae bacterium]|tara:strand:- start:5234 stop:5473 length:240 start_codon:yes stop_codon:yes gene_type:complete
MANVCQITGKKAMSGNNVSHAMNKTKRKFKPNLQVKKFYIPSEDKWITLKVSASGIRNINRLGIETALKQATEKGFYKA